ncbi:hypothetical protein D9M71_310060 [compost metagenome]
MQPFDFQLFAQYFIPRLAKQQIPRVMLAKHLIEQPAGGLDLPRALLRGGITTKHQAGNLGNFTKTPQCHFPGIQAGQHIFQQVRGAERLWQVPGPVHLGRAEEFESVVIDSNRHRQRLCAANPPGNQIGQAQVGHAPGKGIQEQVPALA